jgi:SAM-dependent methyltransferase
MAPALAPVAAEVVRRAELRAGEVVLDIGTGTGNAAALAGGDRRRVIGVDAAPGMLAIARRRAPDAEFLQADFSALPLPDDGADATLAVHALLFAQDRVAALAEWRRVTRPGGRLSVSVPGPGSLAPIAVLGPVYTAYGIDWGDDYPTADDLRTWAIGAGWSDVAVAADPTMAIPLADDEAFRTWMGVGARNRLIGSWSAEKRGAFLSDLMAAAPRDGNGGYRLPFGALYLTARRDGT